MAFEISRRHRLSRALADLPPGVVAHLLPSGSAPVDTSGVASYLRYRDYSRAHRRIEDAYRVCTEYLGSMPS